jgi:hypothetical protein
MLTCIQLDLNDLPNASKDVAGVVLLLPVQLKNYKSLNSQIEQVKRFIPKKGTYPGCVAILYEPPLNTEVPKHNWSYLAFKKSKNEPKLTIEEESKEELEEFLTDIWVRHRDTVATDSGSRS